MVTKITLPPMVHLDSKLYETNETYSKIDQIDCETFLAHLRNSGIPSYAARMMGRGEVAFQKEKSINVDFSAAWDWALREAGDLLLVEARRRAKDGVEKYIYNRGEVIDTVREYSDSLLIKLLEGLHPDFQKNKDDDGDTGRNNTVAEIRINVIPAESFITKVEAEEIE